MKTTFTKPAGLLLALTFSGVVAANSQMIYPNNAVPANAEIYGAGNAGLPDGSGVPPVEFDLPVNATVLSMVSVTGIITLNNGTGHNDADGSIVSGGYYGPTINGTTGYSVAGDFGGISGITMPGAGALVGVFAPADAPTGAPPASLDFTSIGTAFTNLSPALYQTFFIGDGRTGDGSGAVQLFLFPLVPAGSSLEFPTRRAFTAAPVPTTTISGLTSFHFKFRPSRRWKFNRHNCPAQTLSSASKPSPIKVIPC